MAKQTVAGALIIDRIRERITSGRYLGSCQPGQRLPSIREIAEAEGVNRKTVAAAYLRLQNEGVVQVRPRSGIYLAATDPAAPVGPLDRLHRHWLEQTVSGARALGLETGEMLRMIAAVGTVERTAIPVVECNRVEAAAIAEELSRRLGVHTVPVLLSEYRRSDTAPMAPRVVVTTPWHTAEVLEASPKQALVEVTISDSLSRELRRVQNRSDVMIVTGSEALAGKVRRALSYHPQRNLAPQVASSADEITSCIERGCRTALVWPGTPDWVQALLPRGFDCIRPRELLSDASVDRVQRAVLEAAIRLSKTATGPGAPSTERLAASPGRA